MIIAEENGATKVAHEDLRDHVLNHLVCLFESGEGGIVAMRHPYLDGGETMRKGEKVVAKGLVRNASRGWHVSGHIAEYRSHRVRCRRRPGRTRRSVLCAGHSLVSGAWYGDESLRIQKGSTCPSLASYTGLY